MESVCKVTHNGSHYCAVPYNPLAEGVTRAPHMCEYGETEFNQHYAIARQRFGARSKDGGLTQAGRTYVEQAMAPLFVNKPNAFKSFIARQICRGNKATWDRRKRFIYKAYLNDWSYFATFTYDDAKITPEDFKIKLRKCLSNLHTRRGWKYMGVWEKAPETGRLHFHALVYVPDGEMIGDLIQDRSYSIKKRQMVTTQLNTFFGERFGRTEFDPVDNVAHKNGKDALYLLKYIDKTGERIIYSRGIPTELMVGLNDNFCAGSFVSGRRCFTVEKFVLFDDWEAMLDDETQAEYDNVTEDIDEIIDWLERFRS